MCARARTCTHVHAHTCTECPSPLRWALQSTRSTSGLNPLKSASLDWIGLHQHSPILTTGTGLVANNKDNSGSEHVQSVSFLPNNYSQLGLRPFLKVTSFYLESLGPYSSNSCLPQWLRKGALCMLRGTSAFILTYKPNAHCHENMGKSAIYPDCREERGWGEVHSLFSQCRSAESRLHTLRGREQVLLEEAFWERAESAAEVVG